MENTLLIPSLEHERAQPDFTRLRDAVLRTGRSDRLPFLELFADAEIVGAVLGRPWQTDEDKVEFYYRLGYDSVPVGISLDFGAPRKSAPNTASLANRDRYWVCDDICPIRSREDCERYSWPDPNSAPVLEAIENTSKVLPEGMGILVQSGGILESVMRLMGYTGFAEALYDDPELVSDVFEAVGSRIIRVFERVIDCPR